MMFRSVIVLLSLFLPVLAAAHDYPTVDRVEYVHACMRENAGPAQEMIYKCSCVIDAIARDMSYEEYVDSSTAAKAYSIAGEIGESIRDNEVLKKLAARFRDSQALAKKSCFIR